VSKSNYDKFPVIHVPGTGTAAVLGWDACAERLLQAIVLRGVRKTVLVVECYPGVDEKAVLGALHRSLSPALTIQASQAMRPPDQIDALVAPFLGGEDPVFGFLSGLTLPQFFDSDKADHLRSQVAAVQQGVVLVIGCGARLVVEGDILVYADLARWEAQNRFRRNETSNLGVENRTTAAAMALERMG
jgi:mannose-6-phosphate isomerase